MAFIEFNKVSKTYQMGSVEVSALRDVSFEIEKGEFVCILGASGAGKTTALNLLGGMDNVTSGSILVDGQEIHKLKGKSLVKYRRHDIGFVFQFYNLIQNLTTLENVELAVQLCKDHLDPKKILYSVGLKEKLNHFPSQLSGGEQQRVAIARAIAKNPRVLLCDEPTGALDYKTGKQILKLLENVSREDGMTVILITHNSVISEMADKVIRFKSGRVEEVKVNKKPKSIDKLEW